MKVALITLVGLSTALTFVARTTNAATGPARAAPTALTAQQAHDLAMKAAAHFLDLPALRLQAAADGGIAKAQALLDQHMNISDGGVDSDDDDNDETTAEEKEQELGKKTGFSAMDVKQFQAAAASAAANQVPLLTMQDGIDCSDACIATKGDLPDADDNTDMEDADTDADSNNNKVGGTPKVGETDTEDVEDVDDGGVDQIEGPTNEADDDAEEDTADEGGLISRLWKCVVSPSTADKAPAAKAPAAMAPVAMAPAINTETDDDSDDSDDSSNSAPPAADGTAPKAAAPIAAPATAANDKKVMMSEDELLSKVESCVQSCMLNRAKEITPEDLEDRKANMEAVLRKQEL